MTTFADFEREIRDIAEAADRIAEEHPRQVPLALNPEMVRLMANGTFTIQNPKTGDHRTFKIKTPKQGNLAGKQIICLLTGPDNTNDFTGFGFINQSSSGIEVRVWRKHEGTAYDKYAKMVANIVNLGAESWYIQAAGLKVMSSGACAICGRKLTEPQSIERGIGPECFEKLGG